MDVGQNGRLRGPQMEMSSLVLSIHNFGVPNFDPYPHTYFEIALMCLKQCHKPPIWEGLKKNLFMVKLGMVYYCSTMFYQH